MAQLARNPKVRKLRKQMREIERRKENRRTCRECGCTDDCACFDREIGPCRWVEVDLCSHCFYQRSEAFCLRPRFTIIPQARLRFVRSSV